MSAGEPCHSAPPLPLTAAQLSGSCSAICPTIHRIKEPEQRISYNRLRQQDKDVFVTDASFSFIDSASDETGRQQGLSCSSACITQYSALQYLVPESSLPVDCDVVWTPNIALLGGEWWAVSECWSRDLPAGGKQSVDMGDDFMFRWDDSQHGTLFLKAPVDNTKFVPLDPKRVYFQDSAFHEAPWMRCSNRFVRLPSIAMEWLTNERARHLCPSFSEYLRTQGINNEQVRILLEIFRRTGEYKEADAVINKFCQTSDFALLTLKELRSLHASLVDLVGDDPSEESPALLRMKACVLELLAELEGEKLISHL